MISEESLLIVKATAPLVKENAVAITSTFYPKLLGRYPELYNYFNETNQKTGSQANAMAGLLSGQCPGFSLSKSNKTKGPSQAKTLADAIVAYAVNIDNLENLSGLVSRMCHKHAALGIKPEHYQLVHDNLMEAIGEVLGGAVTPEVSAAWSEAVMALAEICIKTEADLYEQAAKVQWKGTREFIVSQVIHESKGIVSIRFKPSDGNGTCPFSPGQYITVFEKPKDKTYFAPRHYTVTSQPGDDFYQITVKQIENENGQKGVMSHYLHSKKVGDTLMLGPIFGPCPLKEFASKSHAAVFISTGVGITATIAVLSEAKTLYKHVVVFHADKSPETMAFRSILESQVGGDDSHTFSLDLSFSDESDPFVPYQSNGKLDAEKIIGKLETLGVSFQTDTDFYVCAGPSTTPLVYKGLVKRGVDPDHLRTQYFGPFATVEMDD